MCAEIERERERREAGRQYSHVHCCEEHVVVTVVEFVNSFCDSSKLHIRTIVFTDW